MVNVFDTAKYILHKQGELSTMKLQKLCYYAQAWSLVWDDAELFPEEFEAWANGPVCSSLFKSHKGSYRISESSILKSDLSGDELTDLQKESIDIVLNTYGDKNSQWLSTLTHMEAPWQIARIGYAPGDNCAVIITKESMAMYYGSL